MHGLVRRVSPLVVSPAAAAATLLPGNVAQAEPNGAGSANYSQVVLADQPSMYWRLGEARGRTAFDSSGNGRDAKYHNGVQKGRTGAIVNDSDTCGLFDGVDDMVSWKPGVESYRGPFSAEAWVRTRTNQKNPQSQHIFFTRRPADGSFDIKLEHSDEFGYGIRVDVGDGTQWFVTQTIPFTWTKDVWYHVVAVATLSDISVYVNGSSIASLGYSGTPLLYDASHRVLISPTRGGSFNGRIDELAVYEYALTADQVAAHYAAGINP